MALVRIPSIYVYSLALILFLFHAFADARLIRGRGRGGITVSFGSLDQLVPESAITSFDLLDASYIVPEGNSIGVPPGFPMLQPVPHRCFTALGSPTDPFVEEPCYWQFEEGEVLDLIGSSVSYFPNATQNITWQIFPAIGTLATPLFEFSNEFSTVNPDNRFSSLEPTNLTSNPLANEIYMNAKTPIALEPGEYRVRLVMEQTAPDGFVFYAVDTVTASGGDVCIEFTPGNPVCFVPGGVTGSVFSRTSSVERLLIVASSPPSIVSLFGASLILIFRLRKRRAKVNI